MNIATLIRPLTVAQAIRPEMSDAGGVLPPGSIACPKNNSWSYWHANEWLTSR